MIKNCDLEEIQDNINIILQQKGLNKELRTFIRKIKEDKPKQLTQEEINFLEEQSDIYNDKYENYIYLLEISESINDIKTIYKANQY